LKKCRLSDIAIRLSHFKTATGITSDINIFVIF